MTTKLIRDCEYLKQRQQYKVSKAKTAARIAMRTTLIPMTVDTVEMRRRPLSPKVATVTRKAAFRRQKR